MQSRFPLVFVLLASFMVALPASWAQTADHRRVTPSDLKWADALSLPPGAKVAVIEGPINEAVPFTVRVKLPANYRIPAHWHPAVERVTVLSGTLHMGVGDKLDTQKTMPVNAGDMMIMQAHTPHFVWNKEEVLLQFHGNGPWGGITYIDAADDPRKK